jgi:hypothetical protein
MEHRRHLNLSLFERSKALLDTQQCFVKVMYLQIFGFFRMLSVVSPCIY